MSEAAQKLAFQALALPCEDRILLVDQLLTSLNAPMQADIDAAWSEEVGRRIDQVDSGEVEMIPGEQAFAAIRERLGK
jgi:putative addiction module component (TIGR02574 family)